MISLEFPLAARSLQIIFKKDTDRSGRKYFIVYPFLKFGTDCTEIGTLISKSEILKFKLLQK